MKTQTTKTDFKQQLETEISKWQTKIDEARLQLSLGKMEAKDEFKVQVDKLESEMNQAKVELKKLDEATTHAWGDISEGLKSSFDSMKKAYKKAKKHYKQNISIIN